MRRYYFFSAAGNRNFQRANATGIHVCSLRSWRYCVLGEVDLAAEPPRAVKPREIQMPRPHYFFLDRGSAAKTLITQYRQLRRLTHV